MIILLNKQKTFLQIEISSEIRFDFKCQSKQILEPIYNVYNYN